MDEQVPIKTALGVTPATSALNVCWEFDEFKRNQFVFNGLIKFDLTFSYPGCNHILLAYDKWIESLTLKVCHIENSHKSTLKKRIHCFNYDL